MRPESFSWKEDGRKRDYSMLAGRIPVNVKFARRRKVQKSIGSTTVQNGKGIRRRSQRFSESGSKKRGLQRKSGSGKEVFFDHLVSESQRNRGYFSMKKCESEKHKSWCMPAGDFMGRATTDGSLL